MDYRRVWDPGANYFFTLVTERRRALLIDHIDCLRDALRQVRAMYPFAIDAIVVLPDHLHTIWTLPPGDSDYSTRWALIKRRFSSGFPAMPSNPSQASRREKGIWQRRFWEHRIRDEGDWRRHMDYIHYNPVKHNHVRRVRDWPYSSFHHLVERGWYDKDWGNELADAVLEMDHE